MLFTLRKATDATVSKIAGDVITVLQLEGILLSLSFYFLFLLSFSF